MTALLDIENVSVSLPMSGGGLASLLPGTAPRFDILDGISLTVSLGETFGLVGESGSGKTTLARAMLGLLPVSQGTTRFDGETLSTAASYAHMRRNAAMMFQDAVASLSPRMSVGALVTEPFIIHGLALPDRRGKAGELLARVGLPSAIAARYPHELSGG
ncbi:ATP-binding cassette domain-containing protein, partial [Aestuariivirga sp.]|uniref:ATP-binding cassette domain-containing protein n=1 Tax=Aestuariivirga sp. TaxID=2650926 RepID=UPI003593D18F